MKLYCIFSKIKNLGIKNTIKYLLGISSQQEQIDTLYYFLNHYVDITQLPPTSDVDLRNLQKCDIVLIKIFDKFCNKHGLDYWLDFGTLLGAVRHHGFIPWDDDMDVAMPRNDFDKACILLHELEQYGIEITEDSKGKRIGLSYSHSQTGIWLDIFPVDSYYINSPDYKEVENLKDKIVIYRKQYLKYKDKYSKSKLSELKKEIIGGNGIMNSQCIYYHGPEFFDSYFVLHNSDIVFPLKKIEFEGCQFNCPNDVDKYLESIYGKSFMDFPRGGIEKHDLGRGLLKTWAKHNNIKMEDINIKLLEIFNLYNK